MFCTALPVPGGEAPFGHQVRVSLLYFAGKLFALLDPKEAIVLIIESDLQHPAALSDLCARTCPTFVCYLHIYL